MGFFLFVCFFFGGGVPKNKKTSICILDIHNSQQLWISIIALWVNMFTRLWIPMFSYGSPLWLPMIQLWISIKIIRIWISKIQLWISVIQSWMSMIIGFIRTWFSISPLSSSSSPSSSSSSSSSSSLMKQHHHHHHHHRHHLTIDSWHIAVEYNTILNTILNTKISSDMNSQKDTHIPRT